jgi:AcrR family transcriptional regulator
MRAKRPYHHGNLRQALIDAAVELIEESGVPALTLREVARRVGVTHAAPQRHFADRAALVAAVAEQGFRGLRAHIEALRAGAPGRDAAQRLRALGVAYIEYGLAHPAHLRVMFSPEVADKSRHPELAAAAQQVHATLVDQIVAGQRAGAIASGDPDQLSFAAWSMVHGCAVLLVDGQAKGRPRHALIDSVVNRLHLGLAPRSERRRGAGGPAALARRRPAR